MTNNKYELMALRFEGSQRYIELAESLTPLQIRQLHAALGVVGEAGELSEMVKKHVYYGKPISKVDIIKEAGDVLFYLNVMLDSIGASFSEAMEANIDKLSRRYPSGYSNEAAIARVDVKESK